VRGGNNNKHKGGNMETSGYLEMTEEKFNEIYTNEEFRNDVAYAHCCSYQGQDEFYGTCSYPLKWVVTPERKEIALKEIERKKGIVLKDNINKLFFEGAGCVAIDKVENCRIRTRLKNNNGELIYLEIIGSTPHEYTPDHLKAYSAIGHIDFCHLSADREEKCIKPGNIHFEYTKENILKWVNDNLNCSFTEIVIDNNNIHVFENESPLCISIQKKVA
jgi:hypothetical protein